MYFLNDPLAGLFIIMAALAIGIPLATLSAGNYRPIKQLFPAFLITRALIVLFVVFWLLPFYMQTGADAIRYHIWGARLADDWRSGRTPFVESGLGSRAMYILTAIFYLPMGPNLYGMVVVAAIVGLISALLFCRAYAVASGIEGLREYALLFVLVPSFGLWTSNHGKDAWTVLGLAFSALGAAYTSRNAIGKGAVFLVLGIALALVFRPHIAAVMILAMIGAYSVSLLNGRKTAYRVPILIGCLIAAPFVLKTALQFVGLENASFSEMSDYNDVIARGNLVGGSAFEADRVAGPMDLVKRMPITLLNVFVRPFPWEANNINAAMASLENLCLIAFLMTNPPRLNRLFYKFRTDVFFTFSALMLIQLTMMLGLLNNLGLISRLRVQVLPFLFVVVIQMRRARNVRTKQRFRLGRGNVFVATANQPATTRDIGAFSATIKN